MVSKRNFFSITIMMFVLLFLFQFSMVIRDRQNTYDVNSNFTTRQKDGKNVSENENITFRVLDGKEISVSRDRLMDTE